jgi:hypothetical protein
MNKRENNCKEPLCMTSEKCETVVSPVEAPEIKLNVGRRIVEAFNYQPDAEIAYILKTKCSVVRSFTEGEEFPPTEILLLIRQATGVSIDWLLTGEGSKRPQEVSPAAAPDFLVSREEAALCGLA